MSTARIDAQGCSDTVARTNLLEEAQSSLCAHAAHMAADARARHDLSGDDVLVRLLHDRRVVRFPTSVSFDAAALEPGEFAHAALVGARPVEGYQLHVHPYFADRPDDVLHLAAYHFVAINYGEIATHDVAEIFGGELLGIPRDEYYTRICQLADELIAWQSGK